MYATLSCLAERWDDTTSTTTNLCAFLVTSEVGVVTNSLSEDGGKGRYTLGPSLDKSAKNSDIVYEW